MGYKFREFEIPDYMRTDMIVNGEIIELKGTDIVWQISSDKYVFDLAVSVKIDREKSVYKLTNMLRNSFTVDDDIYIVREAVRNKPGVYIIGNHQISEKTQRKIISIITAWRLGT